MTWTLVTSAHQIAHVLGFNTRHVGADDGGDVPNKKGLLFWVIYYLEKTVCLRLGCASTVPEFDITVPPPGGIDPGPSPEMTFCHLAVRSARLAGNVYTELYSAQALSLPNDRRHQNVKELATELHDIQELRNFHRVRHSGPSLLAPNQMANRSSNL